MEESERLNLATAFGRSLIAVEHRQRYEFAAELCGGMRVLDLGCGSAYGSEILAGTASHVHAVDNDRGVIREAIATVGRRKSNVTFDTADAVTCLSGTELTGYDAIACFEVIEHVTEPRALLRALSRLTRAGVRLIASVPNSRLFEEDNRFHTTEFSYESAVKAFAVFEDAVMVPQFLAEGSLLSPLDSAAAEVRVYLDDRDEPEYANHFVFLVGFDEQAWHQHRGSMQIAASPVANRWTEGLKRGWAALQAENNRLARQRLGQGGSAAASALASRRVLDLGGRDSAGSWSARRDQIPAFLIPWIERSVPLADTAVVEYESASAPLLRSLAEHARSVTALSSDATFVEAAEPIVAGCHNLRLEYHEPGAMLEALRRCGETADLVLMRSVLEHLADSDRLEVLGVAQEAVSPNGHVVIADTPNRLMAADHQTSRLPFFNAAPDDIAVAYSALSPRADFRNAIAAAAEAGASDARAALTRWGRGVSFHEFEIVFDDLTDRVVATGWDVPLAERPVLPEEITVARTLARERPGLGPGWSRYWLDLIISARPRPKTGLVPWTASTEESEGVLYTRWDTLLLRDATSELVVDAGGRSRVVVVMGPSDEAAVLRVQSEAGEHHEVRIPPSAYQRIGEVSFGLAAERVSIRADPSVHVLLVCLAPAVR